MDRFLDRSKFILPASALMLFLTSCDSHQAKVAFYTFCFFMIFVILCLPAAILSGVARGNGSKSARTTGLVFTCIGGFFAFIYTFNMFEDLRRIDDELIMYLFLIWAFLIGAAIMVIVPNPKIAQKEAEKQMQQQQYYQQQQQYYEQQQQYQGQYQQPMVSDAEIIEQSDGTAGPSNPQDYQPAPPPPPPPSNGETKKMDEGPDMSGLDDLADL